MTVQPSSRPSALAGPVGVSGVVNVAVVAVMWVLESLDVLLRGTLDWFGIHAWNFGLIWTLFTAPFAHGGFGHLAANSVPLLVLGFIIGLSGIGQWMWVTLAGMIGSGLFAFVFNVPGTVTIGASGVVFCYLTYLLSRGLYSRRWPQILIGIVVLAVYGYVLWGVFPATPGVSWQGHLGGAVAGVIIAALLHGRDRAKAQRPSPARF